MNKNQYEFYHEKKTHTSPDFPYNTYLCSIPLDFSSVPIHWHNEMEIIVIKKGQGIIFVDLIPMDVSCGDIIFVLPGQLHSIHQKEAVKMEYENIIFKMELLMTQSHDLCSSQFFTPMLRGDMAFPTLLTQKAAYYSDVASCIAKIDEMCAKEKRPWGYQLSVKAYLLQMFFLIFTNNQHQQTKPRNQKNLDKIKTILTYIQTYYATPISIEEIANECFYSKSHFMKFFKESMGVSFVQYLNDYRLNIAAKMLKETSGSILEIAGSTGFDNLSYFNRMFKRKYGVSPSQYRK